jgi:hypothetical protein
MTREDVAIGGREGDGSTGRFWRVILTLPFCLRWSEKCFAVAGRTATNEHKKEVETNRGTHQSALNVRPPERALTLSSFLAGA